MAHKNFQGGAVCYTRFNFCSFIRLLLSFLSPPPPPPVCLKFALSAESIFFQKLLLAELHAKIKIQVRQNDIGQSGFYGTQKRKTAHKEFLNQTTPERIAETFSFTKLLLC